MRSRRRSSRSSSGRRRRAARRARRPSPGSTSRLPHSSAPTCARSRITDLVVHPQTRNAYLSVMRGQGAAAMPALAAGRRRRHDRVIGLDKVKFSKVELPNAPGRRRQPARRNARTSSITDMAFVDGKLYVAGLSNEEFSSKLRSVPYPFSTVDGGTSVEIYPRQSRPVRDALAGLHVRALQGRTAR